MSDKINLSEVEWEIIPDEDFAELYDYEDMDADISDMIDPEVLYKDTDD